MPTPAAAERRGVLPGVRASGGRVLPRSFYDRPTLDVAADLLGKILVHCVNGQRTSGMIVEVEAYIGESDPACHAAPGLTPRNEPLYGPPGFAYVYLNYGIHSLVNVVTEAEGRPAAVLIRALEARDGLELMRRRRRRAMVGRRPPPRVLDDADLCRGPGNLTMALGITLARNREDLLGRRLFIEDVGTPSSAPGEVVWTPRIGIRVGTERLWRACLAGHPAVSGDRVRELRPRRPHAAGGSARQTGNLDRTPKQRDS
jgi:DNA-3-methyladenine glycosylase